MMKPKAILFDNDGTLVDSASIIVRAYAHLAAYAGYPSPTEAEVKAQLAQAYPIRQIIATFFPSADADALMKLNGEFVAEHIAEATAYRGLHDLLQELRGQGILLGIVTGSNHRIVDVLRHHNIEQYFTSIAHSDRVERSKPHPDGILLALDECGVHPREAIMIGDSPNDIFAGKNAGVGTTIAVTHGHGSLRDLQAADPDYIIDSLPDLRTKLQQLIR